jgi:hypothetical protein
MFSSPFPCFTFGLKIGHKGKLGGKPSNIEEKFAHLKRAICVFGHFKFFRIIYHPLEFILFEIFFRADQRKFFP